MTISPRYRFSRKKPRLKLLWMDQQWKRLVETRKKNLKKASLLTLLTVIFHSLFFLSPVIVCLSLIKCDDESSSLSLWRQFSLENVDVFSLSLSAEVFWVCVRALARLKVKKHRHYVIFVRFLCFLFLSLLLAIICDYSRSFIYVPLLMTTNPGDKDESQGWWQALSRWEKSFFFHSRFY